jgi:hypothetical protein
VAQEVDIGDGNVGKLRSFPAGITIAIITVGIYHFFWYYRLNNELRDIGIDRDDRELAESSPAMSVTAILIGWILIIPPILSIYRFCQRIRRAQRIVGVRPEDRISAPLAFSAAFFGFLIIPALFHYWYVTKHQNRALMAAAGLGYK